MTERYDTRAAGHYAAYRPPLHRRVLEHALGAGESFRVGLDVGCGAGHSAVALSRHCERVIGIDPNPSMLEVARNHPGVSYHVGTGDALDALQFGAFDIVTFAGSLSYAKTGELRRGLTRVCPRGGVIITYDFEVYLDEILEGLGLRFAKIVSDYDHNASLSDWLEFGIDSRGVERLRFDVTRAELAHLILADSNRYDAIVRHLGAGDPSGELARRLERCCDPMPLEAAIFFTRHRLQAVRSTI